MLLNRAAGKEDARQSDQHKQHDAPNKEIGDFRIIREVGRGGMGVVYEAMQISLGRRVALKLLPFAAVLDQRQIARFQNEAQAGSAIASSPYRARLLHRKRSRHLLLQYAVYRRPIAGAGHRWPADRLQTPGRWMGMKSNYQAVLSATAMARRWTGSYPKAAPSDVISLLGATSARKLDRIEGVVDCGNSTGKEPDTSRIDSCVDSISHSYPTHCGVGHSSGGRDSFRASTWNSAS